MCAVCNRIQLNLIFTSHYVKWGKLTLWISSVINHLTLKYRWLQSHRTWGIYGKINATWLHSYSALIKSTSDFFIHTDTHTPMATTGAWLLIKNHLGFSVLVKHNSFGFWSNFLNILQVVYADLLFSLNQPPEVQFVMSEVRMRFDDGQQLLQTVRPSDMITSAHTTLEQTAAKAELCNKCFKAITLPL